jgi:type II secretory pathway pseudopilin PulG
MKASRPNRSSTRAFTLLELSIVIMVLLALIGIGLNVSTRMDDWKLGRKASEVLRDVYSAQRMFLSENPTKDVSTIVAADILPYMRNSPTAMPTVDSLTGTKLGIIVNQSPPVINSGSGSTYDPSGKNNDSLWDVGL